MLDRQDPWDVREIVLQTIDIGTLNRPAQLLLS